MLKSHAVLVDAVRMQERSRAVAELAVEERLVPAESAIHELQAEATDVIGRLTVLIS